MTRKFRLLSHFALYLGTCVSVPGFGSGEHHPTVSGTVSIFDDTLTPAPDARVTFLRSDGQNMVVDTDHDGVYKADLDAHYSYTMTVRGEVLCTLHRPPFRPKPGQNLRFDFVTTECGYIDGFRELPLNHERIEGVLKEQSRLVGAPYSPVVPANDNRSEYRSFYKPTDNSGAPWFFEESVPLTKQPGAWLLIAFGDRAEAGTKTSYRPFSLPGFLKSAGIRLPVVVSVGTLTFRADGAILDTAQNTLRIEGHVSTANGQESTPEMKSCVVLDLAIAEPRVTDCAR